MWDKYIVTMVSAEVYTDIYFSHALFAHDDGCLVLVLNLSYFNGFCFLKLIFRVCATKTQRLDRFF